MAETSADTLIAGLRRAGFRITGARRGVCAVLAGAPGAHLTAAEIATRVTADTSTVYRTLEALERIGYVTHVHMGHGPGVYHVAPVHPHHHLVCESCGIAVDVPARALESAVASVTEPHGFIADATHFAIVGRCRTCAGGDR
ncbi:MAG: transcriptional repressor [Actinobacteria bacterium]|nr:transcriptional repressor [Actinomycetota bacterium]MBU1493023.1 transcriptional repressor [Actinomycetota bacterium]